MFVAVEPTLSVAFPVSWPSVPGAPIVVEPVQDGGTRTPVHMTLTVGACVAMATSRPLFPEATPMFPPPTEALWPAPLRIVETVAQSPDVTVPLEHPDATKELNIVGPATAQTPVLKQLFSREMFP